METKRNVVIGHPFMGRGGSEAAVMWLIETLKVNYAVTVLTTGGWDLNSLNNYYGTHIQPEDVHVRIAPVPRLFRNKSAAALRGACYQRFARQIAAEYDVRISAYNPTDWGMPAIHLIADFSWHKEIRKNIDPPSPGLIYRDSLLRRAYLGIAAAYTKPSGRDILHEDIIVTNSKWSATLMKQICGVECAAIVYPCVWTEFPQVAWKSKEYAFAMIGRIVPEKQIERAIAILASVRNRGYAIRLHLCGHIGNDLYGQRIADLCRTYADWIIPEGCVSGERKIEILTHCQFGIQTRDAEPFGISVAEMVKAGAIVFAPNDGGQVEILDHDDLLFESSDNAINKICDVLSNPVQQAMLRDHLCQRSALFDAETYMHKSMAVIDVS